MKILFIHNFYQSSSPSGEDAVFRNERELLRKKDIQVITYEKDNDNIPKNSDKMNLALGTIWGFSLGSHHD